MPRHHAIVLSLMVVGPVLAQTGDADPGAALSFTHTFSVPMARAQVFDAAKLAWDRSFGLEPAARLARSDRETGVIEGTARINYRSLPLTAREETMGVIVYRVMVQAGNGECNVLVTNLKHTGNHGATHGGLDFGLLTGGSGPAEHRGVSHRNAQRIWADMLTQSTDRITALLNAFGSALRQGAEP